MAGISAFIIWGSLYDETLEWIIKTGDKARVEVSTDSTSWGNYLNSTFQYYDNNGELTQIHNMNANTIRPAGNSERNKANNIYDLVGNTVEFTLESNGYSIRYCPGGYCSVLGTR